MLNPALCSQSKERESESKIPCRQGSCSVMVSVLDLSLEGWSFEFRWGTFWASNRVCQYVVFLFSCSLPFHNHTALEAAQACAKKNRSLKNCFAAKPQFSSSYWGKQCFRSPSLSTYRFYVDWKQPKHVRKKQFFGA